MKTLITALTSRLNNAKRIALLGIGSELRGDDSAGILVAGALEVFRGSDNPQRNFKSFIGATAPENITGEIKRFNPTHLVIVDSADIGRQAGSFALIEPDDTTGVTFSTHRLPTKIIAAYLRGCLGCQIVIIGIQPKSLEFSNKVSREVKAAVRDICKALKDVINN